MYDSYIHAYEKLSLSTAGLIMGLVLVLLHICPLLFPKETGEILKGLYKNEKMARGLLIFDFVWVFFLLLNVPWNPLCMPLFDYEAFRGALMLLCPVICIILLSDAKRLLFPRALGLLILLAAIVPLSAAFLKDPVTRLLIPIWWYPVLTIAMFWVGKPYLFRDWMNWLSERPGLIRAGGFFGLVYGAAIVACALLLW